MLERVTPFPLSKQSKSIMDIKNKTLQQPKRKSSKGGLSKMFRILIWRKKTEKNSVKKLDSIRDRSQIGSQMSVREFGNH